MRPIATMNVIPFIDIMLVLLAVVLTTATFVGEGRLPVRLPVSDAAQPVTQVEAVEISIAHDGALSVDGRATDNDGLARRLGGLRADRRIRLRVDERAAFAHFVAVVDLLKRERLDRISIVTRRQSP
jgi:biopolymer transport protein ExbD